MIPKVDSPEPNVIVGDPVVHRSSASQLEQHFFLYNEALSSSALVDLVNIESEINKLVCNLASFIVSSFL